MSIETLESLIRNPDIWDIELSTQNIKDILIELAARIDAIITNQNRMKSEPEEKKSQVHDYDAIQSQIQEALKRYEEQDHDVRSEIKDLKALFNYQLRDLRDMINQSAANSEVPVEKRPESPPPTVINEAQIANNELGETIISMNKEIQYLMQRVKELERKVDDQAKAAKFTPIQMVEPIEQTPSALLETLPEPEPKLLEPIFQKEKPTPEKPTEETKNVKSDRKQKTSRNEGKIKQTSSNLSNAKLTEARFEEVKQVIEALKNEYRTSSDRLNSTIKAVNGLITEKEKQTNLLNSCLNQTKGYGDEFDRLYNKMAQFQLDMDKKIDASVEAKSVKTIEMIKESEAKSRNADISIINEALQKLKENFITNFESLDGNYSKQFQAIKDDIEQLRSILSQKSIISEDEMPKITIPEEKTVFIDTPIDDITKIQKAENPSFEMKDLPPLDENTDQRDQNSDIINSKEEQKPIVRERELPKVATPPEKKEPTPTQPQQREIQQETPSSKHSTPAAQKATLIQPHVEKSDKEVQTADSLLEGIPTRYINVELQKVRIANEIAYLDILDREPAQIPSSFSNNSLSNRSKRSQKTVKIANAETPSIKTNTSQPQSRPSSGDSEEYTNVLVSTIKSTTPSEKGQSSSTTPSARRQSPSTPSSDKGQSSSRKKRVKKVYVDLATEAVDESPPRSPVKNSRRLTSTPTSLTQSDLNSEATRSQSSRIQSMTNSPYESRRTPTSPHSQNNLSTQETGSYNISESGNDSSLNRETGKTQDTQSSGKKSPIQNQGRRNSTPQSETDSQEITSQQNRRRTPENISHQRKASENQRDSHQTSSGNSSSRKSSDTLSRPNSQTFKDQSISNKQIRDTFEGSNNLNQDGIINSRNGTANRHHTDNKNEDSPKTIYTIDNGHETTNEIDNESINNGESVTETLPTRSSENQNTSHNVHSSDRAIKPNNEQYPQRDQGKQMHSNNNQTSNQLSNSSKNQQQFSPDEHEEELHRNQKSIIMDKSPILPKSKFTNEERHPQKRQRGMKENYVDETSETQSPSRNKLPLAFNNQETSRSNKSYSSRDDEERKMQSARAAIEHENMKENVHEEYEYEYEDDRPPKVSNGVTTDITMETYEEEEDFVSKYSNNEVNASHTPIIRRKSFTFGLEHLLSLTIISEFKPPEQQQIVVNIPSNVQTPEANIVDENGNKETVDIETILKKTLEMQNNASLDSIKQQLKEHSSVIDEIVNTLNDLQQSSNNIYSNPPQSSESIVIANDSESHDSHPSASNRSSNEPHTQISYPPSDNEIAISVPIQNNNTNPNQPEPKQQLNIEQSSSQQSSTQPSSSQDSRRTDRHDSGYLADRNLSPVKSNDQANNVVFSTLSSHPKRIITPKRQAPTNSKINILLADYKPSEQLNFKGGASNEEVELLKERLDKFEATVSTIEDQLYNIEKNVARRGDMRPNSARPLDDGSLSADRNRYLENSNNLDDDRHSPPKEHRHKHSDHHSSRKHLPKESQQEEQDNSDESNKRLFDNTQQPPIDNVELLEFKPGNSLPETQNEPKEMGKSNYYTQYLPEQLTSNQNDGPTSTLQNFDGISIDPDESMNLKSNPDVSFNPDALTIGKYEDQLRILREAVVELRTDMQLLKNKVGQQPMVMPMSNVSDTSDDFESERSNEEAIIRNMRRNIDNKLEEFAEQINDIREALNNHLNNLPEKVVEVRTEVKTVVQNQGDTKKAPKKERPPPPKDLNVDMHLSNAMKMLNDIENKNVINIHKLDLPPDVKEHNNNHKQLIVDNQNKTEQGNRPHSATLHVLPSNDESTSKSGARHHTKTLEFPTIPPPVPSPVIHQGQNRGHEVPQIVHDMKVLNAMPKKDMLELLMPFLYELRNELLLNIDANSERIRCLEASVPLKCDKEYIDTFFRKMRNAIQEADSKASRAITSLSDKISTEDLEERIQELIKMIGAQESTVAGKTNITCLFCGAKRSSISKVGGGIIDRTRIFKGRANRQSLPSNDVAQLPPLSENES